MARKYAFAASQTLGNHAPYACAGSYHAIGETWTSCELEWIHDRKPRSKGKDASAELGIMY